jgi:capsular polysaccharide biosynthesis protein
MTSQADSDDIVDTAMAIFASRRTEELDAALARLIGERRTVAALRLGQLCQGLFPEGRYLEFVRLIMGTHFRLLRAVEDWSSLDRAALVGRIQSAADELLGPHGTNVQALTQVDPLSLLSGADCRIADAGTQDLLCQAPMQFDSTTGGWTEAEAPVLADRPLFAWLARNAIALGGWRTLYLGDAIADETVDVFPGVVNAGFFADRLLHRQAFDGQNTVFALAPPSPQGRLPQAIFINSHGQYNYFHWLVEHLASVWLVSQFEEFRDWPLLICSEALAHPNLVAALHRVVGNQSRQVHAIMPGTSLQVDRLLVPSLAQRVKYDPAQSNPNPEDALYSIGATRALHYLLAAPAEGKPHRRLFIRRRVGTRLHNEDEIAATFTARGFECLYPEDLTFDQKRELFGSAGAIAGAAGAGLANLVLTPEDCVGIVFSNSFNRRSSVFSGLAACRGQRTVHCHAPGMDPGQCFSRFRIEPRHLGRLFERLQLD